MNTCTSTRRKVTRSYGTSWEFGHKACGAPATHVRKTADDSGASGWEVFHCEEHAGEGFAPIVDEPAEVVEEEAAEVAPVVELPAALPVTPDMTEARRLAALAGIPQDDEQLCTALRNAGTAATERRAVAMLVYVRTLNTPGAYEEWQRRTAA
jgi:hypothetical protein